MQASNMHIFMMCFKLYKIIFKQNKMCVMIMRTDTCSSVKNTPYFFNCYSENV